MPTNGHDNDDEDWTPQPVAEERTPPEGIKSPGARRAANTILAVHAAAVRVSGVIRDAISLADLLAKPVEDCSDAWLEDLEIRGRILRDGFGHWCDDIAAIRRNRRRW